METLDVRYKILDMPDGEPRDVTTGYQTQNDLIFSFLDANSFAGYTDDDLPANIPRTIDGSDSYVKQNDILIKELMKVEPYIRDAGTSIDGVFEYDDGSGAYSDREFYINYGNTDRPFLMANGEDLCIVHPRSLRRDVPGSAAFKRANNKYKVVAIFDGSNPSFRLIPSGTPVQKHAKYDYMVLDSAPNRSRVFNWESLGDIPNFTIGQEASTFYGGSLTIDRTFKPDDEPGDISNYTKQNDLIKRLIKGFEYVAPGSTGIGGRILIKAGTMIEVDGKIVLITNDCEHQIEQNVDYAQWVGVRLVPGDDGKPSAEFTLETRPGAFSSDKLGFYLDTKRTFTGVWHESKHVAVDTVIERYGRHFNKNSRYYTRYNPAWLFVELKQPALGYGAPGGTATGRSGAGGGGGGIVRPGENVDTIIRFVHENDDIFISPAALPGNGGGGGNGGTGDSGAGSRYGGGGGGGGGGACGNADKLAIFRINDDQHTYACPNPTSSAGNGGGGNSGGGASPDRGGDGGRGQSATLIGTGGQNGQGQGASGGGAGGPCYNSFGANGNGNNGGNGGGGGQGSDGGGGGGGGSRGRHASECPAGGPADEIIVHIIGEN